MFMATHRLYAFLITGLMYISLGCHRAPVIPVENQPDEDKSKKEVHKVHGISRFSRMIQMLRDLFSRKGFIAHLSVLLFAVSSLYAQFTVTQKDLSRSQKLAGHAVVGFDEVPAEGVTVELCSTDWKNVISSTTTSEDGYFSLEKPKSGQLFYIRLSAPGIKPYQLRVRVEMQGARELTIHLSNAT